MAKHKLRVMFVKADMYISPYDTYVFQKRYLGCIWITKKIFICTVYNDRYKIKQEAIDYMNKYCDLIYKQKQERKSYTFDVVYKTCECERIKNEFNNNKNK